MGHEPTKDERLVYDRRLSQLFKKLMQRDAAFGFPLFNIEIAFEIVVFCLFRDLSKGTQAHWDATVLGPMQPLFWKGKTNMGTAEIDLVDFCRSFEIGRRVETRIGEISVSLEGAPGEIGFAIETRARKKLKSG